MNSRRSQNSNVEQRALPFIELPFSCSASSLFSCICKEEGVPCSYELKQNAPSVALTTDEADQSNNVIAHIGAESTSIVPQSPFERQGEQMETRRLRGLEIATNHAITSDGGVWIVPSQTSSSKNYTVNLYIGTCTCADFEAHRVKCKHIYAAEYALQHDEGESLPASEKVVKQTYRQEWHEYNLAQTNEKAKFQELLYDLCQRVVEPSRKAGSGRNRLSLGDMIFCIVFKVYSTVSGRRFISDLSEANRRGYISKTPHFNTIFNYLELEGMAPYLKDLITESSLPLAALESRFAVDSSGFSTGRYQKWMDAKWGKVQSINKKDWVKLHLICGCKTNIVTGVLVTDAHAADCPQFLTLVEETAQNFVIDSVVADKAYSSSKNLQHVISKGGQPYIPFRSNSTGLDKRSSSVWKRMFYYYKYNHERFLQHYHQRSNVETVFAMMKAKFGERLRSKSQTAQFNELLCKVLCHNLCCVIHSIYEFGIEADFSPQIPQPPAQSILKGGDQQ